MNTYDGRGPHFTLPSMSVLQRVHTGWQWPLSGVHSIMMIKYAQPGGGGWCTSSPFHSIYHHEQSYGVRSSWEGGYTPHISTLPLYVLWGVLLLQEVEKKAKTSPSRPRYSQNISICTEYTECQAFFPVVRIGSPHPLTRQWLLLLPPLGPRGSHTRLREKGWGDPIPTKGQALWYYYVYCNLSRSTYMAPCFCNSYKLEGGGNSGFDCNCAWVWVYTIVDIDSSPKPLIPISLCDNLQSVKTF